MSRAARINPDYEGKGLYRNLDQYLIAWAKSQGVSIKAQTSTHANPAVTKPSFQKQNKLIVSKVTICSFVFQRQPQKGGGSNIYKYIYDS